jgi:PadR family transcriptional regulator PadR
MYYKIHYLWFMKNEFIRNWDTQLKKGLLPLFVLQLLKKKEYYGYELIQELKSSFGIEVTEGTIYPLLIRLTKEGLLVHKWVEQSSGIPRKYYFISEIGDLNFKEMKENIESTILKLK